MLCQLWDRWRLQVNHAGHEDTSMKEKKKLITLMSMEIKKVSFDIFFTFSGHPSEDSFLVQKFWT